MEVEKIGELIYGEFRTEFYITKKVKEYLNKYGVSLGCLIPDAWSWYEVQLFGMIFDMVDGKYKKVRDVNEFKAVYNGVFEAKGIEKGDVKEIRFDKKFAEKVNGEDSEWNFVCGGEQGFESTPEEKDKKFNVKYQIYEMKNE